MCYTINNRVTKKETNSYGKREDDKMALTNEDLQAIAALMDNKLQPIHNRLDKMESRLDKMESRLDKVESRLDKMENRLDKIESEVVGLKKEVQEVKEKVNATYNLALDAWGQSTENRKWLDTTLKM